MATRRASRSQDSRALRSKVIKSYREYSTDDETTELEDEETARDAPPTRRFSGVLLPTRQTNGSSSRLRTSARGASNTTSSVWSKSTRPPTPPKSRKRASSAGSDDEILYESRPARKQRTSPPVNRPSLSFRSRFSKAPRSRKVATSASVMPSGRIPAWATLPYQILLQIFEYASDPIYDPITFQATPQNEWLLQCSKLCKDFAEPALTALYRRPALAPMVHAHRLKELLAADEQQLMSFNYRSKVEAIHMEVDQTAAYTLQGYGLLPFYDLVYNLPRLQELELYHSKDMAPYRDLDHTIKWTYPPEMFIALEKNVNGTHARLKSWRWSARLAKNIPLEQMLAYHQRPYFASLEKVAICNYQVPKLKKGEEDPNHELILVAALSELKNLKHLVLESSTLINAISMPLLPTVEELEIINCWEVTSHDLVQYLGTHGHQLRHLTLNHNVSLSLSFLTQLRTLCPKLESLHMDLTYFAVHQSYRGREPGYETLLEPGEKPEWPSSLRTIELYQLRKWDVEIAKGFYQSLLDAAGHLPDLRRLIVKGILNIGWRDRIAFRENLEGDFRNVFKRQCAPPNPHLRSIAAYKAHKSLPELKRSRETHSDSEEDISDGRRKRYRPKSTSNHPTKIPKTDRSLRDRTSRTQYRESSVSDSEEPEAFVASDDDEDAGEDDFDSEKEGRHSPAKSTASTPRPRLAKRELEILHRTAGFDSPRPPRSNTPATSIKIDISDSDDEPLAAKSRSKGKEKEKIQAIQGMCETVDVEVSNLRPSEKQFTEADFLDSEPEGDEDWDGTAETNWDNPRGGGRKYAW